MKRLLAGLMSAFAIAVFATATVEAQTPSCPPEVAKAKEQLSMRTAKADTVQAPRSLAASRPSEAPRGQDVQAPRSLAGARQQNEAPRGQDVQAPRGQDVQAPRGKQDVQAPRSDQGAGQAVQAPRGGDAAKLIREAEAACKAGNMAEAKAKAEAAIGILK